MNRRQALLAVFFFVAAGVVPQLAFAQAAAGYHVANRVVLGGDGGWDYLTPDTAAHRLYITRGTHVQVVDLDSLRLVGDILGTNGVHGVALVRDLGRGYTSNGRDNSVTVFDLRTLAVIKMIAGTGRNPDAIMFEPVTRRIFTMNGTSGDATAIDVATDSVVGTVPLYGKPEFAVADGTGRVFVNNEDSSQVTEFDARTLRVLHRWSLAPCDAPTGLAFDRAHRRLFAVCGNAMMAVLDAGSGRVVTTVPIGQGCDGVKFDPRTQNAYASNGEGTMTVVHEDAPDRYTVRATVPTARGARTLGLDERTGRVYTVAAEYGPTPAPTADRPRPRPPMVPGSFALLVVEP